MKQKSYLFLALLAFVLAFDAVFVWQNHAQPRSMQTEATAEQTMESDGQANDQQTDYSFAARTEQTAEELLDQSATVTYQDFGEAGKFVKSINGLAGNDDYFWAFYVNDAFAQAGVSQTQLQVGDTIHFVYEKVEK